MTDAYQGSPVGRVVVAALVIGVAIVFSVLGHSPGWPAFAVAGGVALASLLAALAMWRGSNWLVMLAFVLLLGIIFYGNQGLLGAAVGLFLVALSLLRVWRQRTIAEEEEDLNDK